MYAKYVQYIKEYARLYFIFTFLDGPGHDSPSPDEVLLICLKNNTQCLIVYFLIKSISH